MDTGWRLWLRVCACTWICMYLQRVEERGRTVPYVAAAGGHGKHLRCKQLTDMMLDRDLTLSQATLGGVDGRIQEILDCLPPASNLIMSIEEAPTQGGWIINKPVTIESTSGTVRLLCSTEGIQIRASNVTLRGLRVEECEQDVPNAFIHIASAADVLLDQIEFFNNKNAKGPSCVSITESTVAFHSVTAVGNVGHDGGSLHIENSEISVKNSTFRKNVALERSTGGSMHCKDCNLSAVDTIYEGNKGYHGGAVYATIGVKNVKSSHLHFENCRWTRNEGGHYGGGLYVEVEKSTASHLRFDNCTWTKNFGFNAGGGAHLKIWDSENSDMQFNGCTWTESNSNFEGGGIFILVVRSNSVQMRFHKCAWRKSHSFSDGGGSYCLVAEVTNLDIQYEKCIWTNNGAFSEGGGMYTDIVESDSFQLRFNECTWKNNSAHRNGGGSFSSISNSSKFNLWFDGCRWTNNTSYNGGGAFWQVLNSTSIQMLINRSVWKNNTSQGYGGGVFSGTSYSYNTHTQFEGCSWTNNTSLGSGGGLYFVGSENIDNGLHCNGSNFNGNSASYNGGGVSFGTVQDVALNNTLSDLEKCLIEKKNKTAHDDQPQFGIPKNVSVTWTTFRANTADSSGGGMHLEGGGSGIIDSCQFEENESYEGGGLHIEGVKSDNEELKIWVIRNSRFKYNSAKESGGGINGLDGLALKVSETTFDSNSAKIEGGALNVKSSSGSAKAELVLHDTIFRANIAQFWNPTQNESLRGVPNSGGGAVSFGGKGSVLKCSGAVFSGNLAGSGGAVLARDGAQLKIIKSVILNNIAIIGGGIEFRNVEGVKVLNSTFKGNTANQGGAVYAVGPGFLFFNHVKDMKKKVQAKEKLSTVWISNCKLQNNSARLGGGAVYVSSVDLACDGSEFLNNIVRGDSKVLTGQGGGAFRSQNGAVVLLRNVSITACQAHLGGGISVEDALLIGRDLMFLENHALDVGGAISASFSSDFTIGEPSLVECHGCSMVNNTAARTGIIYVVMTESEEGNHRYLLLNNTKFRGNVPHQSDPLVFVAALNNIQVCCEPLFECVTNQDLHGIEESCLVQGLEGHEVLGTSMKTAVISPNSIENYASEDSLPDINVRLLDGFGNTAKVAADVSLTLSDNSGDADLLVSQANNPVFIGNKTISSAQLTARPGKYEISIRVRTREGNIHTVNRTVLVEVRECGVGEYVTKNKKKCLPCSTNLYSFDLNKNRCEQCKPNAHCNGSTLVPADGYWHNSSHSDSLVRCINDKACSYDGRIAALKESGQEHLAVGITWDKGYPLCRQGYEGELCGSCAWNDNGRKYGMSYSLRCEPCIGKIWRAFYVLFFIAVLTILTVLFVRESYTSTTEAVPEVHPAMHIGEQLDSAFNEILSCHNDHEAKGLKPADILKILVNFLQVSTIVTSFKVDWQGMMLQVVDAVGWLSGISSGFTYFAFSCTFQSHARFVYATYMTIILPFAVLVGFLVVVSIRLKAKKYGFEDLKTFWIVSTMAILDITYIRLTQQVVQVLYCVPVEIGNGRKWAWAQDTNIECYKKSHMYLIIFAGFPVLSIVCLGFPLGLFVKLYSRRDSLRTNSVLLSRYGYFYGAYHSKCAHFWEVLVQIRKMLLAVISVLPHICSEQFKGYLAACVLLFSVVLHARFDPFAQQKLNNMETTSLLISSSVCLLAGISHSPEGDGSVGYLVSVLILLLLLGFVGYLMFEYSRLQKRSVHKWLMEQEEYNEGVDGIVSLARFCGEILVCRLKSAMNSVKGRLVSLLKRAMGYMPWFRRPDVSCNDGEEMELLVSQSTHQGELSVDQEADKSSE